MGSDFQGIVPIFYPAPRMQSHLSAYPGQFSVAFSMSNALIGLNLPLPNATWPQSDGC